MSIFTSGVEIPKIRVSGVDAQRVMLGTGSEAVEVWPGYQDVDYYFYFPDNDELKFAPINGFDARSSVSASRAPAFTYNSMFVAGDTTAMMYNTRLIDRQIDGEVLEFTVVLGDVLNDYSIPAYVVLGSNLDMSRMLIVEFGRNGSRLIKLTGNTTSSNQETSWTCAAGDTIRITWNGVIVTVDRIRSGSSTRVAGYSVGTTSKEFRGVNGMQFVGFGLASTSGAWGSRLQSVRITGRTKYKRMTIAASRIGHMLIPNNVWTDVGSCVVHTGDTVDIMFGNGAWVIANSSATRQFRLVVDGVVRATTSDEEGYLSLSDLTIPNNSLIKIEARSVTSNSDHRWVKEGLLQVYKPSEMAAIPTS